MLDSLDTKAIWIIVLAIAAPVSGVVGFAIQLRQVKKTRLENEKLQLEIDEIKAKKENSNKRIVEGLTTEEVIKYSGVKEKTIDLIVRDCLPSITDLLLPTGIGAEGGVGNFLNKIINIFFNIDFKKIFDEYSKDIAIFFVKFTGGLILISYFFYDIYRLFTWLSAKL